MTGTSTSDDHALEHDLMADADFHRVPARPRLDEPESPARRLYAELEPLELLTYSDADAAYAPAVDLEHRARAAGVPDAGMRARLVQADVLMRRLKTAAAGQLALEVNRWAADHHHVFLLCRSHRLLCTFFDRVADFSSSLEHGVRAVELMPDNLPARMRVGHLMGLALALARTRSFEAARERYRAAEQIADSLGDVDLRIHLYNNLAWLESDAGEVTAALQHAEQMAAYAAVHGVRLPASALDTLAHAQMAAGLYAEAERTMQPMIVADESALATEEFDGLGEALLTVAEIQRMQGRTTAARETLQRCLRLCDEADLVSVRVHSRLQLAEVCAAEGNYREAYEQHKLFHAEAEAQYSAERDARARTLQAVFETTEARREGQRFREMSLRDPLTGLHNRRYVDDELPSILLRAVDHRSDVIVALVDLDFFKNINDSLSHDVGDEVLRIVARILADHVGDNGIAARMGGEEFLVVLTGSAATAARLDDIRRAVESHGWTELCGRVPVTVSIGGTTPAGGRTTQAAVLGQADRNLYAAKHAGRNQVVCDE